MSLGIIMKGFNALHNKKPVDFYFEFLPQIIMLMALFGFMDLMIVIKWTTDYTLMAPGQKPPSIITQMITMCLNFGSP